MTTAGLPVAAPLTMPLAAAPQNPAARKAAEEFEAVFVNELLSHMDQGPSTEGPFTGGQSESIYRSLFDDAVAKDLAKHGGIGIADNVYREILRMQEAKDGRAP